MKTQHWIILGLIMAILLYIGTCGIGFGNSDSGASESSVMDSTENIQVSDSLQLPELSENEQAQLNLTKLIQEKIADAENQRGNVKDMLASFQLGMSKREVKKHMLRMKEKKHLVRIQKADNLFEYVYQLKLESGKSNTFMDFFYSRSGGVFKAVCHPTKFRKQSKSAFFNEVRDELEEWYGEPAAVITDQNGCDRYIWITGIQHLDLHCTEKVVEFIYTDLTVEVPPAIIKIDENKQSELLM